MKPTYSHVSTYVDTHGDQIKIGVTYDRSIGRHVVNISIPDAEAPVEEPLSIYLDPRELPAFIHDLASASVDAWLADQDGNHG